MTRPWQAASAGMGYRNQCAYIEVHAGACTGNERTAQSHRLEDFGSSSLTLSELRSYDARLP